MADDMHRVHPDAPKKTVLRIVNNDRLQHYKTRRVPWVKLYLDLLSDPSWLGLPEVSRLHLLCLTAVSARCLGDLPDDTRVLKAMINATSPVNVNRLIAAGFMERVELDYTGEVSRQMLDDVYTNASTPSVRVEKERERVEKEITTKAPPSVSHWSPPAKAKAPAKAAAPKKRALVCEPINDTAVAFEAIWLAWPKRQGSNPKHDAVKAWNARLRDGVQLEALVAGADRYRQYCIAIGATGSRFVLMAATFFGPACRFLEPWQRPEQRASAENGREATQQAISGPISPEGLPAPAPHPLQEYIDLFRPNKHMHEAH